MSIWGRLIGGAAGFALGGPIGAILGVMAGGAFDRRSRSKSNFNFNKIDNNQKQQIFTISFIILSAKLAKSDGQVTDDEIRAFKEKFKVPKSELNKVAKIFNEAKKDSYGYKEIANQVGNKNKMPRKHNLDGVVAAVTITILQVNQVGSKNSK